MKTLTILELSKIYNLNRQTIYNKINKGILSKNSDNKIDLAEAIRVFGEPTKKQDVKEHVKIDSLDSTETSLLRQQIDILKNQLDDAKNRESFYQNQIETMQRLLEAPKPQKMENSMPPEEAITENTVIRPIDLTKDEELTTNTEVSEKENKRIPVPEHVEPEPKKRGFLSRFFLPNG